MARREGPHDVAAGVPPSERSESRTGAALSLVTQLLRLSSFLFVTQVNLLKDANTRRYKRPGVTLKAGRHSALVTPALPTAQRLGAGLLFA